MRTLNYFASSKKMIGRWILSILILVTLTFSTMTHSKAQWVGLAGGCDAHVHSKWVVVTVPLVGGGALYIPVKISWTAYDCHSRSVDHPPER